MISSEDYGGDVERSILIAQEDLDIWKRRVYRLQNEKKVTHNDNVASILMSIALCAVTLYILDYMKIMFDVDSIMNIFTNIIVQATSTGLILISIWIYLKSNGCLHRTGWKMMGISMMNWFGKNMLILSNMMKEKKRRKA